MTKVLHNMQTNTALLEQQHIPDYIPHRDPFIMVDKLYECDANSAKTGFMVLADNVLVNNGYLQESGILENIAQSFALKSAYYSQKNQDANGFKMGFIAGIKNYHIYQMVPIGKEIITTVRALQSFGNMFLIEGWSMYDNKEVAKCELQLFQE